LQLQQVLTEKETAFKVAIDDLKQAEWKLHNAILEMKDSVRGQYGSDSHELQAIGIKRKSSRKRPATKANVTAKPTMKAAAKSKTNAKATLTIV
jgi:hypothetical protein